MESMRTGETDARPSSTVEGSTSRRKGRSASPEGKEPRRATKRIEGIGDKKNARRELRTIRNRVRRAYVKGGPLLCMQCLMPLPARSGGKEFCEEACSQAWERTLAARVRCACGKEWGFSRLVLVLQAHYNGKGLHEHTSHACAMASALRMMDGASDFCCSAACYGRNPA